MVRGRPAFSIIDSFVSQAGPLLEGSACEFERKLTSVKNFAIIILQLQNAKAACNFFYPFGLLPNKIPFTFRNSTATHVAPLRSFYA